MSEVSTKVFGTLFRKFLEKTVAESSPEDSEFVRIFSSHFQTDPAKLPVITEEFPKYDHPNLHKAFESYLTVSGRSAKPMGVTVDYEYMQIGLSQLVKPSSAGFMGGLRPTVGPVQYVNLGLADDQIITCVQSGVYLINDPKGPLVVFLRGPGNAPFQSKLHIDVMALERVNAENFLAEIRQFIRKESVYRGKILSLSPSQYEGIEINFHRLAKIDREKIILPNGLLERIERQTVYFGRQSSKLLAAGRHLKRGLLLHGPPGTGKTLTAMYLAGQMADRTVLLLTGRGMSLIEQSCTMARLLQPAIVILEDVDLVAEERTRPDATCTPLLFELLNQMDGLGDDADIIFLLTTNRPDLLEPALTTRPGRVDQAIELPLPDRECRRRLFELYSQGLTMRLSELDRMIERTEGTTGAFIRELIRKAALFAADEAETIFVEDKHVEEALRELVTEGGELTSTLNRRNDYHPYPERKRDQLCPYETSICDVSVQRIYEQR